MRAGDAKSRIQLRHILVVAQVTLSLILLVCAGFLVRTFANLDRLDLGFRPKGVLTLTVSQLGPAYSAPQLTQLWNDVLTRVRTTPGITSASLASITPLSGGDRKVLIDLPGSPSRNVQDRTVVEDSVSDGYFKTFGISIVAGRDFNISDRSRVPLVAILNEAAARAYLRGREAVGQHINLLRSSGSQTYEVIGVVRDTIHLSVRAEPPRFIYLSELQPRTPFRRLTLAVKTGSNPRQVATSLEKELQSVNPDVAVTGNTTLEELVQASLLQERLLSTLSGLFGVLALILSTVGLYGLLAHVVEQRTGEIGIRIALGASTNSVVWMVLRRTLYLVGVGIALGIPVGLVATRPLASLFYGIQDSYGATIGTAALILMASALVATYVPALRAARIDPNIALRRE